MMREVGDGEVIVTNDRDGLSWLTHHPVTALPYLPNARTRDSLIADAVHSANRDHATVLFFRTITPALWYSFPESAFVRACGCRPDTTFGIGAVYRMH